MHSLAGFENNQSAISAMEQKGIKIQTKGKLQEIVVTPAFLQECYQSGIGVHTDGASIFANQCT